MAEYIRIDRGVKRGQRKPARPPYRRGENGEAQAIPPDLDPKTVLDLYLCADTTSQVARQLGVRRSSLTLWLRERCPEEWKNIQIARALIRKEDADVGLERAPDALSLARAREMLRSGQWDLERLDAPTFGEKHDLTVHLPQLGPALQELEERRMARLVGSGSTSQTDASQQGLITAHPESDST